MPRLERPDTPFSRRQSPISPRLPEIGPGAISHAGALTRRGSGAGNALMP
jgi:hypothetical protein